jgi:hypothetical protein
LSPVTASDAEVEAEALASLSVVERRLFGRIVKASAQSPGSRFDKNLPRFGPRGAARLLAASLWCAPVWFLVIAVGVVGFIRRDNHPYDAIVPLMVVGFICIAIGISRLVSAVRLGRAFRQGHEADPTAL